MTIIVYKKSQKCFFLDFYTWNVISFICKHIYQLLILCITNMLT